jgi:Methylamine utilisation protein MauE
MELIGIFFVACGLLVLAGAAKAVRPDDTARALVLLFAGNAPWAPSIRRARLAVRLGALLEAALGVAAILLPRPATAALVAASYALFTCVVLYARRAGGVLATCGCFARPDTPPTNLHVVLNLAFVAAATGVAIRPLEASSLLEFLGHQPWLGFPLVFVTVVGVWLAYLALSPLASLEGARRLLLRPSDRTARP